MGLNLNDKKAVVAEVSAQVANAQTIVIAEYRGIEVTDLTVLRRKARESGVYLRVLKNTLVRRAVAGTSFAGLADQPWQRIGVRSFLRGVDRCRYGRKS